MILIRNRHLIPLAISPAPPAEGKKKYWFYPLGPPALPNRSELLLIDDVLCNYIFEFG